MTQRRLILIIPLCIVWITLRAQELKDTPVDPAVVADQFFRQQDGDFNYDELYENYLQALAAPSDLNQATADDFRRLHILSENQISVLLEHRQKTGSILSIYELQGLKYFDLDLIRILNNLFHVGEGGKWKWKGILRRLLNEKNNYLLTRLESTLEQQSGYREAGAYFTPYRGSPIRSVNRFRSTHSGDFSVGLLTERDAGEKFRWNPASKCYGPDFISGFIQVKEKGKISNLIVGDYLAGFGQGLILSSGFSTGKGSETVTSIRKATQGFTPYSSTAESGFFRGAAISWKANSLLNFHAFASSFSRDGELSINQDSIEFVGSLYSSGYHRTTGELSRRKTWREQNAGLIIQLNSKKYEFGIISTLQDFSIPVLPRNTIYNSFDFRGHINRNFGFYFNRSIRNFSFFSEYARSANHAAAWLAGCLAALTPHFDVGVLFRKYDPAYTAFYGGALAEHTQPENEQGIYVGWKYKPDKKNVFTGYVDYFEFPWLGFRSYQPSAGHDLLLRYSRSLTRKNVIWIQYRFEEKIKNIPGSTGKYYLTEPVHRASWVLNFDYRISDVFSARNRIQINTYNRSAGSDIGYLAQQDIYAQFRNWKFSVRYALFDAASFDVRLYAYERDVWMSYSFPAYYGKGVRTYIQLQYRLNSRMDIWFRWANTTYADRNWVGYGFESIKGNSRNDLKIQLRVKL